MSTIFADTMRKAIQKYRQLLRKFLPQAERISKLHELGLKNNQMYTDDVWLFKTGYRIVQDIRGNLTPGQQGYYSYSGVEKFAGFLKDFLDNYKLEGNQILHRAQIASRAMVEAIQLITQPRENLNESVEQQLEKLNEMIALYGSDEQKELHRNTLQNTLRRQQESNLGFYKAVLSNFKKQANFEQDQI